MHGENLIRARDVNLPSQPTIQLPEYTTRPENFTGRLLHGEFIRYLAVATESLLSISAVHQSCFASRTGTRAMNQFESAATSIYHGMTVSLRRRMTSGLYFRLAYTWAHAIDDGQDALVTGSPVTVQNTYSTRRERGPSVTDQRSRLVHGLRNRIRSARQQEVLR